MDRVGVLDLCSAGRLARQNHQRRSAHRPAADTAGCSARKAPANRQDGEGPPTRLTDSASHPDAFALVIVALAESLSVADDRVVSASRASPRQAVQRNYPGSTLSFVSGSAIYRITAFRSGDRPSPSTGKVSPKRKKNIAFCGFTARRPYSRHWPVNVALSTPIQERGLCSRPRLHSPTASSSPLSISIPASAQ